ncbi:MAG: heavy metal translocating P-type ATPase, partial [Lachnospiraceae bacterium]|nr:heavy metal translocating P-type ATPase [Lachnospiraceae bacterium]
MNDFLAGLPMTIVGGVFLVMSFVFPRAGIVLPIDPAWVTVMICGIPLLYLAGWRVIYNKGISKISSALLISIAMIAAIAIGDLFAAGEVAFIMEIGAILEDMTTNRAKKGLKKLISLTPTQGRRITDDNSEREEMIPADQICQNDILRILPGETIPVDGIIIQGETSIDQSIMTGESLPVDKGIGENVFCGTINRFGSIDIKATKVGEDSSLQKLIRMVQDAENKQAPMQRIADKCASWLVPVALLIAIITGIATNNIVRAVTVLVVFCPCALVLATPTAIMAAIGQATKHGVIIKSGETLEKMGKVNTIAFDKTGTLTYGKLEVSDIISFDNNMSEKELLALTASAEAKSEHPLGKAIVAYAKEREITIKDSDFFQMQSGKGICAEVSRRNSLLYTS